VPVSNTEIEGVLGRRAVRLRRQPSEYRTSFPLEEVDVELEDGTGLELMLKEVGADGLSENARGAKPAFLSDPLREIDAYRFVLSPRGLGPRLYGTGRSWLLLERVAGVELYQVGEDAVWQGVARWLARMHEDCRDERTPTLLAYDRGFYRTWPARALSFTRSKELARLLARYDAVIERLLALPLTFVHGELYASNVLVVQEPGRLRVCPVDWEMAAVAPGLVDLAALTSGSLSETQRLAIAGAYFQEVGSATPWTEFLADLDRFRLHLALQWLGWSQDWTPPPEQAHDWLGEALRAGTRLGL
jgi:hypothetical protein